MKRRHFFFANMLSAVLWALLYVSPGILIGSLSSQLSAESATRLFLIILALLLIIWLASLVLKFIIIYSHRSLSRLFHNIWIWSKHHPKMSFLFRRFTPTHERVHHRTVAFLLSSLWCSLSALLITLFMWQGKWGMSINRPTYLFLQSLHTKSLELFFMLISMMMSPLSLTFIVITFAAYLIYQKEFITLKYWICMVLTSLLLIIMLASLVHVPSPRLLSAENLKIYYPGINLTLATCLFGFLIFYLHSFQQTYLLRAFRVLLSFILALEGFASVYLGSGWLTTVLASYLVGWSVCLSYWLFFRLTLQNEDPEPVPPFMLLLLSMALILTTVISYLRHEPREISHYATLTGTQYLLSENNWWNQTSPLLPKYRHNRFGHPVSLLNIQYSGSLNHLQSTLESSGWTTQLNSFVMQLILRAGGTKSAQDLPLITPLYLNQKPSLTMTLQTSAKQYYLLRLWSSNYQLIESETPLWIGTIHPYSASDLEKKKHYAKNSVDPYIYLLPDLKNRFEYKKLPLPNEHILPSNPPPPPFVLLLVREAS